jgi:hypothetical protein
MADEDLEPFARQLWGIMQRVAMQIAGMPLEQQESAFAIAERSVRQMATEMKIADGDDFVNRLMGAIRKFVTEIDVGDSPQGGRA